MAVWESGVHVYVHLLVVPQLEAAGGAGQLEELGTWDPIPGTGKFQAPTRGTCTMGRHVHYYRRLQFSWSPHKLLLASFAHCSGLSSFFLNPCNPSSV